MPLRCTTVPASPDLGPAVAAAAAPPLRLPRQTLTRAGAGPPAWRAWARTLQAAGPRSRQGRTAARPAACRAACPGACPAAASRPPGAAAALHLTLPESAAASHAPSDRSRSQSVSGATQAGERSCHTGRSCTRGRRGLPWGLPRGYKECGGVARCPASNSAGVLSSFAYAGACAASACGSSWQLSQPSAGRGLAPPPETRMPPGWHRTTAA
mmetsp:Transcript_90277/g.255593  ORF Transcript_90277/g.255593 Transcript_90277/m.255593 type:complete len:212 (-) Transcript_90277:851-1486(-)